MTMVLAGECEVALPSTPDELAAAFKREVQQIHSSLASALSHAIQAGLVLLAARELVEEGTWQAWVEDKCAIAYPTAYRYMLLAEHRDEVEHSFTSITKAYQYLRGINRRPRIDGRGASGRQGRTQKHDDETIAEARRLYANGQGLGQRDIAELLGVSQGTVSNWVNKDAYNRSLHQQRQQRQRRLREREAFRREELKKAATHAGDATSRAYAHLRSAIADMDKARLEADNPDTRKHLGVVQDLLYQAEDQLGITLRTGPIRSRTKSAVDALHPSRA